VDKSVRLPVITISFISISISISISNINNNNNNNDPNTNTNSSGSCEDTEPGKYMVDTNCVTLFCKLQY